MAVGVTAAAVRIPDQVQLHDIMRFDLVQPFKRVEGVVSAVNEQVGHIQQQSATSALAESVKKIGFAKVASEADMRGDVLQENRLAASISHPAGVVGENRQHLPGG